ncbi:MAG: hypothetical protein K2H09_06695 [Treponemataceae bacterium]|nr:hypothetical protein [Treponemataceae bacterium]
MLTFNLQKEWYKKFLSGEKTIEYRFVNHYWTTRLRNIFHPKRWSVQENLENYHNFDTAGQADAKNYPVILRYGYTPRHMTAEIEYVEIINGSRTDLQTNRLVYAIHLTNIKEIQ